MARSNLTPTQRMQDATGRWSDALVSELYDGLKSLAHKHLRSERAGHTLGTTGLVHEVWLRLADQHSLTVESQGRFWAIAAETMRRVLVDHARRRTRGKRGAAAVHVDIDEVEAFLSVPEAEELVVLDDAITRLQQTNARAMQVVVARYFGGLTEEETARALDVSPATVRRDWLLARAWLRREVAADLAI